MPLFRFVTLSFVAAVTAAILGAQPAAAPNWLSPQRASAALRPDGREDFELSPAGSMILLETNRGTGLWTVPEWEPRDLNLTDEVLWRIFSADDHAISPDDRRVAAPLWIEGKPWIGVGDLRAGEPPRRLVAIPKDFFAIRVAAWSPDGQGVYLLLDYRLQRPRSDPRDDYSPLENRNAALTVSGQYVRPRYVAPRITSAYEGAIAFSTRNFIVYLDLATRQLRRVFTGNDLQVIHFSPDFRTVLAVQNRPDRTSDLYLVKLPPVAELPAIDLITAKEAERDAGWFDAQGRRLKPILTQVPLSGAGRHEILWAPTSDRFAYFSTLGTSSLSLLVYDLALHKSAVLVRPEQLNAPSKLPEAIAPAGATFLRAWGNDDVHPVWTAEGDALLVPALGQLYRANLADKKVTLLTAPAAPAVTRVLARNHTPAIAAVADGQWLVTTFDPARLSDGLARLDPATGEVAPLHDAGGLIGQVVVDSRMDKVVFSAVRPDTLKEIFETTLGANPATQQRTTFSRELAGLDQPPKELISYTTEAGAKGYARFFLPPGTPAGVRVPLILLFQSRMQSIIASWRGRGVLERDPNTAQWNAQGYAVLWFEEPYNRNSRELPEVTATSQALLAALDTVTRRGVIDETRIAAYATEEFTNDLLDLLTRTDRIRAAAVFQGYGDPTFASLLIDAPRQSNLLGATFVAAPDRYRERNVFARFSNLKTPLLVMSHAGDPARDLATEQIFRAADQTGVPTVFARYNKYPGNDLFTRPLLWFSEHFAGEFSASGQADLPLESQIPVQAPAAAR